MPKDKLIIADNLPQLYEKIGLTKGDQQNIVKMIKIIHKTGGLKENKIYPPRFKSKFNKKEM